MTDISKRLAEIRERNDLVRDLHGNGWDDHATDAEMDRSVLLAAVEAALGHHEPQETANGVRLCPHCSAAAGVLVPAPCPEVRDIAAALETGGGEAR